MRTAIVCMILFAATAAHADEVAGVVVDDARVGIAGASVRIVETGVVVVTRTDRLGQFRVTGVPPGPYRVEVDRGTVRAPYGPAIHIDREEIRCCVCAMMKVRVFETPVRRGHVDTTSTALGTTIFAPGR